MFSLSSAAEALRAVSSSRPTTPHQPPLLSTPPPPATPPSTSVGASDPSRWPRPPRFHARRRRGTAAAPDRRGRAPFLRVDAQAPHPHSVLQRRSCPCHATSPH